MNEEQDAVAYSGYYKKGDQEIEVMFTNDFNTLTIELEGVKFTSDDLETWKLDNSTEYSDEQLDSFTLGKNMYKDGYKIVTEQFLKDFDFGITIPQVLKDKISEDEKTVDLAIEVADFKIASMGLSIMGERFEIDDAADYDNGQAKLNQELNGKYAFKNCLGCQYSGYNVYGQSLFGSLLCFKGNKAMFNKVKNKEDYLTLQEQGYQTVQEIDCCSEYAQPTSDSFQYKG